MTTTSDYVSKCLNNADMGQGANKDWMFYWLRNGKLVLVEYADYKLRTNCD